MYNDTCCVFCSEIRTYHEEVLQSSSLSADLPQKNKEASVEERERWEEEEEGERREERGKETNLSGRSHSAEKSSSRCQTVEYRRRLYRRGWIYFPFVFLTSKVAVKASLLVRLSLSHS